MSIRRSLALAFSLIILIFGAVAAASAAQSPVSGPPVPQSSVPPEPARFGPFGDTLGVSPAAAQLSAAPAAAPTGSLTTYILPVGPTNLLPDNAGSVWFTAFGDYAFGRLNLATGQVETYKRDGHNVWGVAFGAGGRVWFGTVNAFPDYLISLVPATGSLNLWGAQRDRIYGLAADRASGDVWFASTLPPAINRLAPDTGALTSWSTLPYTSTFDLALGPDGMVWATVQPFGKQALLRLDPSANKLTAWELPVAGSRPFRVHAPAADAIWLSEAAPSGNALARFAPAANRFYEYILPVPAAAPMGVVAAGTKVWTALSGANALAQLDAQQSASRVTVRPPTTLAGMQSSSVIAPASLILSPTVTAASGGSAAPPVTSAGAFRLAALPANSGPFGVAAAASPDEVWFAATNGRYLGRLALPHVVHLPYAAR